METLNSTYVILIGLALRVAIPVAFTALIVFSLRKLDARWQAEAREEKKVAAIDEMPCLREGVTIDPLTSARASLGEQRCWQIRRLPSGYLNEACLDCEVFLNAPTASAHSHAHI